MTDYVGEEFRVTTTGTDWDKSALVPAKVTGLFVEIWNAAKEVVIPESEMAWVEQESLWEYLWLSTEDGLTTVDDGGTAIAPGSYRAKIKLIDLDGKPSWEFVKIRLSRNPVGG